MTCGDLARLVRAWGLMMPAGAQGCRGLVAEDSSMPTTSALYWAPARRFVCHLGHSLVVPLTVRPRITRRRCQCGADYPLPVDEACRHELASATASACRLCRRRMPTACGACLHKHFRGKLRRYGVTA